MPDHVRCPSCSTFASPKTLEKFNGVCRRCHKQPIAFRKQWMAFAIMSVGAIAGALIMNDELAGLEAGGGTKRVNVVIFMAYKVAGRIGVATIFLLIACLCGGLSCKSFRSAQIAATRMSSDGSNDVTDQ